MDTMFGANECDVEIACTIVRSQTHGPVPVQQKPWLWVRLAYAVNLGDAVCIERQTFNGIYF